MVSTWEVQNLTKITLQLPPRCRKVPTAEASSPDERDCSLWHRAKQLQQILKSDRTRKDHKRHETNFPSSVTRNLRLYNITFPPDRVDDLSAWIYENPNRCPAVRLGYEVFHKLLKNVTDGGEVSDIPDFAHVDCIPYVDAITLDNRMRGYVAQSDQSLGTLYSNKVYRNIGEIEKLLQNTAA